MNNHQTYSLENSKFADLTTNNHQTYTPENTKLTDLHEPSSNIQFSEHKIDRSTLTIIKHTVQCTQNSPIYMNNHQSYSQENSKFTDLTTNNHQTYSQENSKCADLTTNNHQTYSPENSKFTELTTNNHQTYCPENTKLTNLHEQSSNILSREHKIDRST